MLSDPRMMEKNQYISEDFNKLNKQIALKESQNKDIESFARTWSNNDMNYINYL